MTFFNNPFTKIEVFGDTIGTDDFFETRIENDGSGNPLYIGRSPIPNESTANNTFFIQKLSYDGGGAVSRIQIPDDGGGFIYAWDDRATYFS